VCCHLKAQWDVSKLFGSDGSDRNMRCAVLDANLRLLKDRLVKNQANIMSGASADIPLVS
jgi:hypothetical protein